MWVIYMERNSFDLGEGNNYYICLNHSTAQCSEYSQYRKLSRHPTQAKKELPKKTCVHL
jgi:hypothetical protein